MPPTAPTPSVGRSAAPTAPPRAAPRPSRAVGVLAGASGLAFAAFPLLRPWGEMGGTPEQLAAAFGSELWVASHVAGMLAWALLAAALLGRSAPSAAATGRPVGLIGWGALLLSGGVAALLPYYGAEAFALHVLGESVLAGEGSTVSALVPLAAAIRGEAWAMTLFGVGLLAAALGVVLVAVGALRMRSADRIALLPVAALVALYLPQFFAADAVRVLHGLLLSLALCVWAIVLVTARSRATS